MNMGADMRLSADDVVKQVRDLPALSAVVIELLASLDQADLDVHVLGAKIATDQSLTAKTLRLANSSFYGMPSKVTTIHQAIAVLGFHSIRTLVTACAVTGSFSSGGATDLALFWRHSIATAIWARLLAPRLKLNPEMAFTTGLLHDIGTLVLATRFPQQYSQVQLHRKEHDCFLIDAEQAVLGLDHTTVGSALAAWWKFPQPMQEAVARHHQDGDNAATLANLIMAANVFAHALDLTGEEDELAPAMPQGVWERLALDTADCERLFAASESMYADMAQILLA